MRWCAYPDEVYYLKYAKTGIDIDFYLPSVGLAVQAAGCAALGLDGHGLALDLCGQILGSSYGLSLVEIGSSFLAAGNVHSAGICHSGQLAREQIVAGVAVGHLMDLVLFANALDILLENHFHVYPSLFTGTPVPFLCL